MRVALIYPEVYDLARFREERKEFPPFGPLYLAAAAERAGHEVEIISVSPGCAALDLRSFDAVGFSISASATYGLIQRARREAQYAPGAVLMAGGVHANFYPDRVLEELDVDVVAVGDSEAKIVELLDAATSRRFDRVAGVWYRHGGVPTATAESAADAGAEELLPARHLLPRDDVVMTDRLAGSDVPMAHVMFSRGCPYKCRFCAVAGTPMRYRSGASARAELEHLVDRYGIGGFAVVDDNFIIHPGRVIEICDAIADLELPWSALSRVNTLRPRVLDAVRRAGCIELKLGMESGSPRILEAMNKTIRPEQIRRAVRDARALGIGVKLFLVHGFPGEDVASSRETLRLLSELAPDVDRVSLFRFVPLPGTEVYREAEAYNLRGTDRQAGWDGDWSKYHIHHNDHHWWGDAAEFAQVQQGYEELRGFVDQHWPEVHQAAAATSAASGAARG